MKPVGILAAALLAFALQADYALKEGDTIHVRYVLGAEGALASAPANDFTLQIPPGGVVSLPYVGAFKAQGKTVPVIEREITTALRRRFPLGEAFVILNGIRPTFYSIIGEVREGGQYTLPPGLTLREALAQAGGTNRRPETLNATIFRNGKLYKTFDIFEATAAEDPLGAEIIEPGDVISIQTRRQIRIWIAGMTKGGGEVSVEGGRTLQEIVARFADVPANGELRRETVYVTVTRDGRQALDDSVFNIETGTTSGFEVRDGDFISIGPRETNRIWVFGSVAHPGRYDIPVGSNIMQALSVSGGANGDATLRDVAVMRGGNTLELDLARTSTRPGDKLTELETGDIVVVGANMNRIAVLGEVNRPGLHFLKDDMQPRVSDALSLAGGNTRRGPTNRVVILRPGKDGEVERIPVDFSRYLRNGDAEFNPVVLPGDIVMVGETPRIDAGDIIGAALGLLGVRNLFK